LQEPVVGAYAKSGDFILGTNRRLKHKQVLESIKLKFEQSKGLFEKTTRRAIEDYLDDVSQNPDWEDPRFKALLAFEATGSVEAVFEAFRFSPGGGYNKIQVDREPIATPPGATLLHGEEHKFRKLLKLLGLGILTVLLYTMGGVSSVIFVIACFVAIGENTSGGYGAVLFYGFISVVLSLTAYALDKVFYRELGKTSPRQRLVRRAMMAFSHKTQK
jgi:hypothetical protein